MNQSNKRKITVAVFLVAFAIGFVHFFMGLQAIFVFRNNEPLASWVGIISGPLSTLPATFLALFKRKLGGYWLIIGGVVSFVAIMMLMSENSDFLTPALRVAEMILLPMIGLGSAFLLLTKAQNKETEIRKSTQQANQPDAE